MTKALTFIKKESVFMIAFLFAILSMLVVPLDREYQNYIDISVLILLFCLMAVVGGMREIGLFSFLSQKRKFKCYLPYTKKISTYFW